MNRLRLEQKSGDQVRLLGIDWVTAACLQEVPQILTEAKSGPARERLFPAPTLADADLNEDWRQLVVPELERIFASAGQILGSDIAPLLDSGDPATERTLSFPSNHCDAWMSAINQARLVLGAMHDVTEADMDDHEFDHPDDPREQAVLRIHILGNLLQVFVEFGG